MTYTVVLTFAKTAESSDDAFQTMPTLMSVATAEQAAAHRAAFPSQASVDRSDPSKIITTIVYSSKEVHDAQEADALSVQIKALKDAWIVANHIEFSATASGE